MMWYAWNYGKEPEEAASSSSQQKDKTKEDIWKAKWLEKLERRECVPYLSIYCYASYSRAIDRTMIQILLYLLKISLPGPCPAPSFISPPEESTTSPSKKRKHPREERKAPVELLEEQLELYMDKLSSWQLMDSINPQHARDLSFMDIAIAADSKGKPKDDRHWTVAFSQEIVDILYETFYIHYIISWYKSYKFTASKTVFRYTAHYCVRNFYLNPRLTRTATIVHYLPPQQQAREL